MNRSALALETLDEALADMNNDTPMVDDMGAYIEELARMTQVVDWEGNFTGTIADELRWRKDTEEWLSKHSNNPDSPNYSEIYSDVFKDMYGFRPRWYCD